MSKSCNAESKHIRVALVTGASGYIGSHVVKKLINECWRVHIVIRPSSSLHLLDTYIQQITVHTHDGSTEGMIGIVSSAKPDVVYHLAAMASSDHQASDVDKMIVANILFSTQLVEAMSQNGVKNLVNTETFWQHKEGTHQYDPVCLYAATKQAFRDILIYYINERRLNSISLVLFDTYGADDPRYKLFAFLKRAAQENQQIDLTLGEQIVDMIHVDDVAAAYFHAGVMLLSASYNHLISYAVTSGQRMTLKQLVELIVRETGVCIQPNWGGKPYRTNEVMNPWLGKQLPGWQPKLHLADGMREVFKVIR